MMESPDDLLVSCYSEDLQIRSLLIKVEIYASVEYM
jgi:hypothetical protein